MLALIENAFPTVIPRDGPLGRGCNVLLRASIERVYVYRIRDY